MFHLLKPRSFPEHGEKFKMENIRACLQERSKILDWRVGPKTSARHPRPRGLKCRSSEPEAALTQCERGGEGQQPSPDPYKRSPQGVKARRAGQFAH